MSDEIIVSEADYYSECTVYELKDELKERGLKVSGKKADLVARLVADLNSTIEAVENVIEQTEEAIDAIETAADEMGDVSDKLAEKDIKGALSELKDASDDIEKAAEETIEAAEDALETAEDLSNKGNRVVTRWNALSKNQKIIAVVVMIMACGFSLISGGYITV